MRHKHYDVIVAWAEGKTVQFFNPISEQWEDVRGPSFSECHEWRIKPEPKPDVVKFYGVNDFKVNPVPCAGCGMDQLKLIFDGETGKLKQAEIL